MPMSNSVFSYSDVAAILDRANEEGGLELEFAKYNQAVRWRMRAYYLRQLLRKQSVEIYRDIPEKRYLAGTSPYDRIVITISEKSETPAKLTVRINSGPQPIIRRLQSNLIVEDDGIV